MQDLENYGPNWWVGKCIDASDSLATWRYKFDLIDSDPACGSDSFKQFLVFHCIPEIGPSFSTAGLAFCTAAIWSVILWHGPANSALIQPSARLVSICRFTDGCGKVGTIEIWTP